MEPLQIIGFIVCLWAMAFLVGFGVMMGAWAGVKAGTWAFGPFNVKVGGFNVRLVVPE